MNPRSDHFRSIDALRGGAMLLGVLLHALIPYLSAPVPHLLWPVREPAPGTGIDLLYWWIHGFRVPLFFVIGGMFAAMALSRRGTWEFMKRRLWRIGVPLVIGTFTVVMLMYLVWSWGWLKSGLAEIRHIKAFRFGYGMQKDLYGVAHLWFLEYLLIYSGLLCVWEFVVRRGAVGPARSLRWWLWLVPVPTACVLMVDPRPLTEFHNWFWPRTAEFLYHGWFFAIGAVMGSRGGVPGWMVRGWWVGLGASIPAMVWFWGAIPGAASGSEWPRRAEFAAAASLLAWASIWGWLGVFVRFVDGSWGPVRLGALAAYWVYVTHPPVVGLAQVLMYKVPLSPWAKVTISFGFAMAFCMASYWFIWRPLATRYLTPRLASVVKVDGVASSPKPG